MVSAVRMRQYPPMFPRTALVTGSASGIGRAIVELLRSEGADVQALDLADGFDVSDAKAWDAVGEVELACLNAGVTTGEQDLTRLSDDAYRRILGANLDGVVFGARRLAAVMMPGSAIVATASLSGTRSVAARSDLHAHETCRDRLRPERRAATRGAGDNHQRDRAGLRRHAADPFRRLPLLHAGFRCHNPTAAAMAAPRCAWGETASIGWATRTRTTRSSASRTCRRRAIVRRQRVGATADLSRSSSLRRRRTTSGSGG